MRKLASIRLIDAIKPIDGADSIECATVGGWDVVVKKGEFNVGDAALYFEVDSWVPSYIAPFLTRPGHSPKLYNEVPGERLKTIRLRGQISQGLLLPYTAVMNHFPAGFFERGVKWTTLAQDEFDVTEVLGIQKWEPMFPAQLAGNARGNFPSSVPKTDQERCQNIKRKIEDAHAAGLEFEVTEKLEGSSCTFYLDLEGDFHVCSRNLDLQRDDANTFWSVAIHLDVEQKMRSAGMLGYAIQGELCGSGIQGNLYGLTNHDFYVFDIYDVKAGDYLRPAQRRSIIDNIGLKHVPLIESNFKLTTQSEIIQMADGKSQLNKNVNREGLVFKQIDADFTFKSISNIYLLKQKD